MSITLTAEMADMIRDRIEAGEYASVSEFLRDSIRAWQREQNRFGLGDDVLRAAVEAAERDPERLTGEECFGPILAELEALERAGRSE